MRWKKWVGIELDTNIDFFWWGCFVVTCIIPYVQISLPNGRALKSLTLTGTEKKKPSAVSFWNIRHITQLFNPTLLNGEVYIRENGSLCNNIGGVLKLQLQIHEVKCCGQVSSILFDTFCIHTQYVFLSLCQFSRLQNVRHHSHFHFGSLFCKY